MSEAPAREASGRRVLIVEDDPGIAELERERLEAVGCACDWAATGRAAREAIDDRRPDLMILDYSLPDMWADELLASGGLPPFLIATGKGDEVTAVRLMRAGARDYVIKDSSFLDELPLVVDRVLRAIATERSLEERLRENEALLREIHHRVKNNLQVISSLIRLQAPRFVGNGTQGLLIDVQSRISAMALIHEILYGTGNLAEVDFLGYVEALSSSLSDTYCGGSAALRIACSGDRVGLPIDRAVPLGLIANELITNAIKHAFPASWKGEPRVEVRVARLDDGGLALEVADNGVGMPAASERERERERAGGAGDPNSGASAAVERQSLGLKLVDILGSQIGADVSMRPAMGGSGLEWRIAIGG
jgi:two-component sensor histidine kinase